MLQKLNLLITDTGAGMYRTVKAGRQAGQGFYRDIDQHRRYYRGAEEVVLSGSEDPDAVMERTLMADGDHRIHSKAGPEAASVVSTISEVPRMWSRKSTGDRQRIGAKWLHVPRGARHRQRRFPNADIRIFFYDGQTRGQTRHASTGTSQGVVSRHEANSPRISSELTGDVSREDSPLTISQDAIVIDTEANST